MKGLSLFIFSKDCFANTVDLIKDMYNYVDEIVLIDQSKKSEREALFRLKKAKKFDKLNILYTVSLGYPDMLRMYALKKCSYDWVIFIDTDERLSIELKTRLKELMDDKYDAYAIRRYEEVKDPGSLPLFSTWQTRLFRKNAVTFKGIPHEQAIVDGDLKRLEDKEYYMMHLSKMMNRKAQAGYGEIEKFGRLTYKMYRDKMLEYLSKFKGSTDENKTSKLVSGWMKFYQSITFKSDDQELTNFDYFTYYAMHDLIYYTMEGNFKGFLAIIPEESEHVKKINKWQMEDNSNKVMEISKIINNIGITRFLELDKESEIDKIKKKYSYKNGGVKLLLKLMYEKYDRMRQLSSNSKDKNKYKR